MGASEPMAVVLERYAAGPNHLAQAVAALSDGALDTPVREGGWTVREVVHHVADGDDIWKRCIKMAIVNEDGAFDLSWYWARPQEEWARYWRYAQRAVDVSLQLLQANRNHILQLLAHVPEAWIRSVPFPRHDGTTQRVTVGEAVQIQADHLMHHVRQIRAVRKD